MNLDAPDDRGASSALEPGAEIVAYCHSGSRSAIAAQILRAARLRRAQLRRLVARVVAHDDLPLET